MIDTSKLDKRAKQLYGSFRLETPITASSGKFAADAYAKWREAKLADIARAEESEKIQQANKYETRAGTRAVIADGYKGTGSF